MAYVYKIVGNFEDIANKLDKISDKFVLMYTNRALYVALAKWENREDAVVLMDKVFRPMRNYFIEEVTSKTLQLESDVVKDWCVQQLIRIDTQKYESEHQDKLKAAWYAIDKMEAELQKLVNNREDNNGKEVEMYG